MIVEMSGSQSKSELDAIIAEVKEEFRNFLIKRRELVITLGSAFEKVVGGNSEGICEEIKNVLSEEITQKLVSRRDIERYCPDNWKQKTKPKNDNLSFSSTEGDVDDKAEKRQKITAVAANPGSPPAESMEAGYSTTANTNVESEVNHQNSSVPSHPQTHDHEVTNPGTGAEVTDYVTPPDMKFDELSRTDLIDVTDRLRKQLANLKERHDLDQITIKELKAASEPTLRGAKMDVSKSDKGTEPAGTSHLQFSTRFELICQRLDALYTKQNDINRVTFHVGVRSGKVFSLSLRDSTPRQGCR
jgi:hypothetical protein